MFKPLSFAFVLGLAALIGWSSYPNAQTTQSTDASPRPVPGPYQAAHTPDVDTANTLRTPAMRQMMPYWMRPAQSRAGQMMPPMRTVQQQFIPGWVWSQTTPNGSPTQRPRPSQRPGPTQRPIIAYGYQNGPQQNPYFGPGPMWQPSPPWVQPRQPYGARNYRPNYPYGAPPQSGAPRQMNRIPNN